MTTDVFTASGTFTPPAGCTSVDVLVVGGGGGGGSSFTGYSGAGGGGGAGGCRWVTSVAVTPGAGVAVTVGAGGAGGTGASVATSGGNSSFAAPGGTETALGGGNGYSANGGGAAATGGSGGGGGGMGTGSAGLLAGLGTAGQGNNGGTGNGSGTASSRRGGGGGGAGAVGTGSPSTPAGGVGVDHTSHVGAVGGAAGWFSGGGGGGQNNAVASALGGTGGGGRGDANSSATAGTANTGGGGGGGRGAGGAGQPGGSGIVVVVYTVAAPGVPTSVSVTDTDDDALELSWSAPSTGGTVTDYEVRIDGGSASSATSPHIFTGLTPSTSYTLSVRAVGPGGASSWVDVVESTTTPTPPGYYRVEITLGSHSWDITQGDEPAYGPILPFAMGWEIPDSVEFFPAPPSITAGSFRVQTNDAADLDDVVKGSPFTFRMYVDADPDAEPWQWLNGVVTQLEGEVVPSSADADKLDFVTTVYFADDTARLADAILYEDDWTMETIADRLVTIDTEAHIWSSIDPSGVTFGVGMIGWLPARSKSPISVLDALRATLRDAADYVSSSGDWYGRYVFNLDWHTDPVNPILYLRVFRRRLFPGGIQTATLDGAKVRADTGKWTKQPGSHAATWGLVDDTTFGTPDDSPPFVRKTSLVSLLDGAPDGDSATEILNLGSSMLPDGSTALDGWSSRSLTYLAYLDPDPVGPVAPGGTAMPGWVSLPEPGNSMLVRPVVITPIGPELELNGVDYVAGTLTGARLVIPPGGKFVIEFRLRAELLDGTDLP